MKIIKAKKRILSDLVILIEILVIVAIINCNSDLKIYRCDSDPAYWYRARWIFSIESKYLTKEEKEAYVQEFIKKIEEITLQYNQIPKNFQYFEFKLLDSDRNIWILQSRFMIVDYKEVKKI